VPKSKETIQSREDAIKYVSEHLPGSQFAFAKLSKDEFVAQLLKRIQRPKLINQGQTNFCGPAAALHALAKDDPVAYAKLGLDLFVTGKAMLRGWTVDAGNLTQQAIPDDKKIDCCDWVMMACVRKNVGFGHLTDLAVTVGGTYPKEVASALLGMGYKDVRNETYTSKLWMNSEKNLAEASVLCEKGYRVILFVNDNMFKNPAKSGLLADHFCTLKSKVLINDAKIFCRVWQWGLDHKEPKSDPTSHTINLPKEQFIGNYFGYLAGGEYQRA